MEGDDVMIKKERKKTLRIRKYEALLRRLPQSHPKREQIQQDYKKYLAGFRGELAVDYHLKYIGSSFDIYQDVRLPINDSYFQIDTLLVSQQVIVILEVKNFAGTLHFDEELMQMIRTFEEKEEGYAHPIFQVKRNALLLKKRLSLDKFPDIPIEFLVVISNPSTIIKFRKTSYHIIHAGALPDRLITLHQKYKYDYFEKKDLKRVSTLIQKKDIPDNPNLLQYYSIPKDEILKGVHCPACHSVSMTRNKGFWNCPLCKYRSKTAHIDTFEDYALLIDTTITNQECRCFFKIASRNISYKILKELDVCKGKKYQIRLV